MQFGVFTVGDVTPDPTTGRTPTEARADQGDGRRSRRRPRRSASTSSPPASTTTRRSSRRRRRRCSATSPAQTERLLLSTATTLITTNDPVKIAEDYAMLQHLADGRVDLMHGPRQHRPGLPVVRPGHPRRHRRWRSRTTRCCAGCGARTSSTGRAGSARRCRASPRRRARSTACRRSSGTARSAAPRSPSRPRTTATASSTTTSSGRPSTPGAWSSSTAAASSTTATARADQAIVGLGGQVFMRQNCQDAVREFRPYFDNAPVYGHGPSLEDFTAETPLTVGSPQQVIDRTLGVPRLRRRLPAPAVPDRPRRPAAEDRARAARHARRGGRAGAAPEFAARKPGPRTGRPDPRVAGRRRATPPPTDPPATPPPTEPSGRRRRSRDHPDAGRDSAQRSDTSRVVRRARGRGWVREVGRGQRSPRGVHRADLEHVAVRGRYRAPRPRAGTSSAPR